MEKATQNRPASGPTLVASISAALLWSGVLAFLAGWIHAYATGHLEPATGTSFVTLVSLALITFIASITGISLSVKAWSGASRLSWQVTSVVTSLIMLLAASGD